jgi:WD40 repeat protein
VTPELGPGAAKALISEFGGHGLYDVANGLQELVIPSSSYSSHKATFSADGTRVISTSWTYDAKREAATVNLWDVASAKRILSLKLPGHAQVDAAVTPDGKHLITSSKVPVEKGAGEFFITAWEVPSGAKKSEFREDAMYTSSMVATAGDNTSAAVITAKGKLMHFDIATGKATQLLTGIDSYAAAPIFSPDGKSLALMSSSSFSRPAPVVVLDWATGRARATFACPEGGATCAAFTPDGRYLITGTSVAGALVWELPK